MRAFTKISQALKSKESGSGSREAVVESSGQTDRQTSAESSGQTDRQTFVESSEQTDRQTFVEAHSETEIQTVESSPETVNMFPSFTYLTKPFFIWW